MKTKNIALVVVESESSDTTIEGGDIVLPNIQNLINTEIASAVYDFSVRQSRLEHDGKYIQLNHKSVYRIDDLVDEVIIAGGSLGNEHYDVFKALLQQYSNAGKSLHVNIPLNCTYSFTQETDSGDKWNEAILGNQNLPILKKYNEGLKKYASNAYLIERDGSIVEKSPVTTLKLWTDWKEMSDYIVKQ
jgi:hypothetical protein